MCQTRMAFLTNKREMDFLGNTEELGNVNPPTPGYGKKQFFVATL